MNSVGAAVWRGLGYQRMQANWALPKLLWLLRDSHRPARGWRTRTTSSTTRLVGREVATDLSNALKTGVDLIEERWPYDVFDELGVPAEPAARRRPAGHQARDGLRRGRRDAPASRPAPR